MDKPLPLVSIGVPVFNESRFIFDSLSSLACQSYPNIELIVSDNGSTDGTFDICEKLGMRHKNIKISRLDKNVGSTINFRRVLENAKGKYFMWASGHDLWELDFVEHAVEIFESTESAVLVFGSSRCIDSESKVISKVYGWTDTRGMDSIARFWSIYWGHMNPVLGLIRRETLSKCGLKDMIGSDLVLLLELSLCGDFVHATKSGWSRRVFRNETSYIKKKERYQGEVFKIGSGISRIFPMTYLIFQMLSVIIKSNMEVIEKFLMCFVLLVISPLKYVSARKVNAKHD